MLARSHGEPTINLRTGTNPLALDSAPPRPSVGFMFGDLAKDPANRLPDGASTISALKLLGAAMAAEPSGRASRIPAVYTYFGQFIDHDITKSKFDASLFQGAEDPIARPDFPPLMPEKVGELVTNERTPHLDLESLYEVPQGAEAPDGRMILGSVTPTGNPIKTSDPFHDLPRLPMIPPPRTKEQDVDDRRALIGDPRNDENLIVGQLHVAFLRAHNALIGGGATREEARRQMRRRYQWAILHDFLPRICDGAVVDAVNAGRLRWRVEDPGELFMPLEFSGAAYRFGHSMVRRQYNHNRNFEAEPFVSFFTFTALSGNINLPNLPAIQFPTLPSNWIIEWPRFFAPAGSPGEAGLNPARTIDTQITPPFDQLPNASGEIMGGVMARLATRNLLRGYLFGLPTGQAVAKHLGVPVLSADALRAALPESRRAELEAAGLLERTPLWFYILAEAGDPAGPNGEHLGPVGSTIVAETLWNMARHAQDSVIGEPPTEDEKKSGDFTLQGIVRTGQDQGMDDLLS